MLGANGGMLAYFKFVRVLLESTEVREAKEWLIPLNDVKGKGRRWDLIASDEELSAKSIEVCVVT